MRLIADIRSIGDILIRLVAALTDSTGRHDIVIIIALSIQDLAVLQTETLALLQGHRYPNTPGQILPEVQNALSPGTAKDIFHGKTLNCDHAVTALRHEIVIAIGFDLRRRPLSFPAGGFAPIPNLPGRVVELACIQVGRNHRPFRSLRILTGGDKLSLAIFIEKFQLIKHRVLVVCLHVRLCIRAEIPAVSHMETDSVASCGQQLGHVICLHAQIFAVDRVLRSKAAFVRRSSINIQLIHAVRSGIQTSLLQPAFDRKTLSEQRGGKLFSKPGLRFFAFLFRDDPITLPVLTMKQTCFKKADGRCGFAVIICHFQHYGICGSAVQRLPGIRHISILPAADYTGIHAHVPVLCGYC